MSNHAAEAENAALGRLEAAVAELLTMHSSERARADRAETELRELEQLLKAFEVGTESPKGLSDRVERLEAERDDLRARLAEGRDTVKRVVDRIRFLEERK